MLDFLELEETVGRFWHRLVGIGDVVVKATEGRTEESHVLRGVPDPVGVSEAIRAAWNQVARPRGTTNIDG